MDSREISVTCDPLLRPIFPLAILLLLILQLFANCLNMKEVFGVIDKCADESIPSVAFYGCTFLFRQVLFCKTPWLPTSRH